MQNKLHFIAAVLIFAVLLGGCQQTEMTKQIVRPSSLRDVPAQRLSYRYEADVPAPPDAVQAVSQEKLTAIQADFDQHRGQETLYKTVLSPDKQRALAIYNRATDEKQEFRLDLYDASGKLIRKITPEGLSLVFPDIVTWSPNSETVAFSGARRISAQSEEIVQEAPTPPSLDEEDKNANSSPTPPSPFVAESPTPNAPVLTFRTEQIYLANRDGADLKPLTQKEGLIYFYFAWSPDGAMLAALAAKENEWQQMESQAASRGEMLRPFGRPRLLEKNGRERLLDDNLSDVHPVFSPDSSKLAIAYRTDVRIYDTIGEQPTSAAIPLQIQLLTSAQAFDDKQKGQAATNNPVTTLRTDQPPASFNPIVALRWSQDDALYLQTGYVKDFASGELVRSFMRWHKLNLSPQGAVLN